MDVLPCLTDVLRRLPAVEDIDLYLPDRWLTAHPEHRLVERELPLGQEKGGSAKLR